MRILSASVVFTMLVFLSVSTPLLGQELPASLREKVGRDPISGFTLTTSRGEKFQPEDLKGKVWVAHFFFTTCLAGCSQTSATMAELQKTFQDHPHFGLVSISLNPDNDSKEVLRDYAQGLGANQGQWFFLTGSEKDIHEIVQKKFFQSALRDEKGRPGYEIVHSFALMLVDHEGNLVGFVDGRDATVRGPLEDRIRELLRIRQAALEPARIWFPRVNASLNGLCGLLLVAGYVAIRNRKEKLHIFLMASALAVSAVFLACYLYYHFLILQGRPTLFRGEGGVRVLYFSILLSHTILAVVVAPLAIYIAYLGWRDRRPRHVRLARWTLPLWLYVSVTGVAVYWMLYHWYPPY